MAAGNWASGAEQKCTTREVIGQRKCPRQLFGRSVTEAGWQQAGRVSVRSARKWQRGPLPSTTKQERRWRTRPDPCHLPVLPEVRRHLGAVRQFPQMGPLLVQHLPRDTLRMVVGSGR